MKSYNILIQFFLLLVFIHLIFTDKLESNVKIVRQVIGSGGINGSKGDNLVHYATAGQSAIGRKQKSDSVFIGFWIPCKDGINAINNKEINFTPTTFRLYQNYPNPFNPETTLQYDLTSACRVKIELFNVMGQQIRLLINEIQGPGRNQITWDARDEQGEPVGSGIYLYRITTFATDNSKTNGKILFQQTNKMLLVK